MSPKRKSGLSGLGDRSPHSRRREQTIRAPVIGLEAEFTVYVGEERRLPEQVFRHPQQIVRAKMIPRTGRSCHLPSGGALYFDTGVIEVATPIIELEPGCCLRAVRSLWEQIAFVRQELDFWEIERRSTVRLEGFSAHYNISVPPGIAADEERLNRLARHLTYLLPAPGMLLAANRRSTGIGVRPREGRLEITADFTPDPKLMLAAGALFVGIVTSVMSWPELTLADLESRGFPIIEGYAPRVHTSRQGWLARYDCYPQNPFTADPNARIWKLIGGETESLRGLALRIAQPFRRAMLKLSDRETVHHLFAVLKGRARSLLDFDDRPAQYEDVGRVIDWGRRRRVDDLPRSKYEQVIHRIITHQPIKVGSASYAPERMSGWYKVVFRDVRTGRRRVFNLDQMIEHCAI